MKLYLKISVLLLVLAMLLVPTRSAAASSGVFDGKIILGDTFTLADGEILTGDLVVIGGAVTIEDGATVEGTLAVIGGDVHMNGAVKSDMAVIGGSVTLSDTAHVYGDLVMLGGSLERADGARVDGNVVNNMQEWNVSPGVVPDIPNVTIPKVPSVVYVNPLRGVSNAFGEAVGFGLIAMLLMLFLATQTDRVLHTVLSQPLVSGGIGLLTMVVVPIGLVLMAITIILIPLTPVVVVALVVAGIFGWVALGYEVGKRVTKAFKWNWHPSFIAGLGTFLLTILAKALSGIPVLNCVGWLVPVLLTLAGIGAVIMTRFGTHATLSPAEAAVVKVPSEPSAGTPA
jgi:hypothetical protein